ncbi:MAG: hypothetical protein ACM34G_15835 [Acidobacteriota bacterium]
MVVRLVELISKPTEVESVCHLFETQILPQAQSYPGFAAALCLALHPEPRIVVLFTLWQSKPDSDRYCERGLPKLLSMLRPRVDGITMREFDVRAPIDAGEMAAKAS